jgi:hypothetical protein
MAAIESTGRAFYSAVTALSMKSLASMAVIGGVMTVGLSSSGVESQPLTLTSDPTWTIPISGVGTGTGLVIVQLSPGGFSATCDYAEAGVRAQRGTGLSGTGLISMTSITVSSCRNSFASPIQVTFSGLPWQFNATAYDPDHGTVVGRLSGITVTAKAGASCTFTLAAAGGGPGQADVSYTNSTGEITVNDTGHLHIVSQTGCPVDVGDTATIEAFLLLDPRGVITSP